MKAYPIHDGCEPSLSVSSVVEIPGKACASASQKFPWKSTEQRQMRNHSYPNLMSAENTEV